MEGVAESHSLASRAMGAPRQTSIGISNSSAQQQSGVRRGSVGSRKMRRRLCLLKKDVWGKRRALRLPLVLDITFLCALALGCLLLARGAATS